MRIAVAGGGRLAVTLLRRLLESSHDIVAVVQNGRRTRGIRRTLRPWWLGLWGGETTMPGIAKRRGIPIVFIDEMGEDELRPLRSLKPDVLLVGGFDIILKRLILDLPSIGCVNAHSSLLPKHRGPNPFCAVLLAREKETGVTFHLMEENIDTGAILDQQAIPIGKRDTALTLYARACVVAGEQVIGVMDHIERCGLQGTPQDEQAVSYEKKATPKDMAIDWAQSAEAIDRHVRAHVMMGAHFHAHGRKVCVERTTHSCEPVDAAPGTVLSSGTAIRIATGCGVVAIEAAYTVSPVVLSWPAWWNRPKQGEKVS